MRRDLERLFPRLAGSGYEVTSPATPAYNCIAWAAGDESQWWWPDGVSYWPPRIQRRLNLDSFVRAYATLGFRPCPDGNQEDGYEKITLYIDADGIPTHAARQLPSGRWTSKLGQEVDIEHGTFEGLEGKVYGATVRFLRRRIR